MKRRFIEIACKVIDTKIDEFVLNIINSITPEKFSAKHSSCGKMYKYTYKKMVEALYKELKYIDEEMDFNIRWNNGSVSIYRRSVDSVIRICTILDTELTAKVYSEIESLILKNAVEAFEVDLKEHNNQHEKSINELKWSGENIDEYPKCMGVLGEEIDIEKNPGYFFTVNGFKLGACYRMWFGKEAYEILDKETLRNFPCYENVVLDNDVTRITLYENIQDYKKKENRDKQWEFRRALHIDEIAHRLLDEEKEERKRKADPEITIQQGNFEHGGVRLVQTYLKDGERVKRSQADSVEEQECTLDGKVVYRVIRKLY